MQSNNGGRTLSDAQLQIRAQFLDFFDHDAFKDKYDRRFRSMMDAGLHRMLIDVGDLLDFTPPDAAMGALGKGLLWEPVTYLPLCEVAVQDIVLSRQPEYLKVDYRSKSVHVGLEGAVGEIRGPRELYARQLNTMVAVEGIITRQSPLRPRLLETVHYCAQTNKFSRKEYRDQLSPMLDATHLPTVNLTPKTDSEGNLLRTELGLSQFVDSQCAMLQEAPENSPTGQLPRSIELRLDDDLVDAIKPGDRVVIVGVFSPFTVPDTKGFQTIILVNHVYHQHLSVKVPRLTTSIEQELTSFAQQLISTKGPTALIEMLGRSIAPSIYGLNNEKQAILLQLIGGVERAAHHSHIRGDINILLVGEPSTAKSQLLRYVLNLVPLALSTTGKGSSGVGLTAAVTTDPYTGERSLSAGAMVLADRGVLCVDEFDKMSPQDRVAMHEAMEQQTVTIAKAGIQASLNARCSVLAAANPIYGMYSVKHKLAFNVGLPESLISRFDLVFIILDQHGSDYNRRIGGHILKNHMAAAKVGGASSGSGGSGGAAGGGRSEIGTVVGVNSTAATAAGDKAPNDENAVPGGSSSAATTTLLTGANGLPIVSIDFLRKYIQLARQRTPMLNVASQKLVTDQYVQLRTENSGGAENGGNQQSKDGFLITARTLEAIIRLASAHAKLRLSDAVEEIDVNVAMMLLRASVHASSEAAAQRAAEKQQLEGGGPSLNGGHNKRPRDEAEGTAVGDPEVDPVERRRQIQQQSAPGLTAMPLGSSSSDSQPASAVATPVRYPVLDILRAFQKERADHVTLADIAARSASAGISLSPSGAAASGAAPSVEAVQAALQAALTSSTGMTSHDRLFVNSHVTYSEEEGTVYLM